ncbi:MAG TPA: hypothetical protein VGJ28_01135 [Micromonosporaceae bacterium]|jgi:hypothetical protein
MQQPTGAPAGPAHRTRRTAGLLAICALGLAGWIVYLGFTLSQHYVVRRWGLAWMGLDIAEATGLLSTALLLRRRSLFAAVTAASTSTLFLIDAWFDTVTSNQGLDYGVALGLAFFGEIPLSILCAAVAVRVVREFNRTGSATGSLPTAPHRAIHKEQTIGRPSG